MAPPQQTATLRPRVSGRGAPRHQAPRAAAPPRTFFRRHSACQPLPSPWCGRGRPATPGGDVVFAAASAATTPAAPFATPSPASGHPPAAAVAVAPAPDGQWPAPSPPRLCQPPRRRHGQTSRCRRLYGRRGAPFSSPALPHQGPDAATPHVALPLPPAPPAGQRRALIVTASHGGGCGRRRPRRRRSPRPAAGATVVSTGGSAGVRAERAANASVHTLARRGGTDRAQLHGGATRPWSAATPRPMHVIHTEEGASPAAMQTTPPSPAWSGAAEAPPQATLRCRRPAAAVVGGGVAGGGRAAAVELAGVRCPTVPPTTFHKAAERRAAASTADMNCRAGPKLNTHD